MDPEAEARKFKFLLFAVIVFLVSAFVSWKELKYGLSGKATAARLVELREKTGRRGAPMVEVRYAYKDATGQEVRDSDTVGADWPVSEGQQAVQVQYLANGESRLAGHRNVVAVVIFFASLLCVAVFVILLWRDTRQAVAEKRRFTSRSR